MSDSEISEDSESNLSDIESTCSEESSDEEDSNEADSNFFFRPFYYLQHLVFTSVF